MNNEDLYGKYNATSTDDGHGGIETYESWLERRLISRIEGQKEWHKVEDHSGNVCGEEMLLFNESWKSEYNPQGIRIGFYDDVMGWTSAYWCSYHDEYHTRTSNEDNDQFEDSKAENQIPTHWRLFPDDWA